MLILACIVRHLPALALLYFSIIEVFVEQELREEIVLWKVVSQVRDVEYLLVDLIGQLDLVFSLNEYFCQIRNGNLFERLVPLVGIVCSRYIGERVVVVTLNIDLKLLLVIRLVVI